MENMRIIFHIDANSAYLSWTAVHLLETGSSVDIREIPAVISGDPLNRHGIILAKSMGAKKYGIGTGQSLMEARQKCPDLAVYPPDYDLYMLCSNAMYQILLEYSPLVERYSIDECFVDFSNKTRTRDESIHMAFEIKDRIHKELGFTVNIGVSTNKLLAKMGSELQKPNKLHTLWPEEVSTKLWPLPVGELFMVGRATSEKLKRININTIGDFASADPNHMKALLKAPGLLAWEFANGIDDSPVINNRDIIQKGVGNSITIPYDVVEKREVHLVLLALTERVSMRLRKLGYFASLVSISFKTDGFQRCSHQMVLPSSIQATTEIYEFACLLFGQCWKGDPIRQIGVSVSNFSALDTRQLSFFDGCNKERNNRLDHVIDAIREKYGTRAIIRGAFANGLINPVQGGTNDSHFIMMGGYSQ